MSIDLQVYGRTTVCHVEIFVKSSVFVGLLFTWALIKKVFIFITGGERYFTGSCVWTLL